MKVVLLGDSNTGKSQLRSRFMGQGFKAKYIMTIGADFALKETVIRSKNLKFQIWDISASELFSRVRKGYILGARGALIVFDVTQKATFRNVLSWIAEFWANNSEGGGIVPLVLLGNKADLRDQSPDPVPDREALALARILSRKTQPHGFIVPYLPVSTLSGENVDRALDFLGRLYLMFLEEQKRRKKASSLLGISPSLEKISTQ